MIIPKWNFKKHEYELTDRPDDKTFVLYTTDMDMQINCTNCLKDMTFGEGYTSRQWHNPYGIAFPVCEDCYEKEIKAEKASKK